MKCTRIVYIIIIIIILMIGTGLTYAQLPPVFTENRAKSAQRSPLTECYLSPVKIIWKTETEGLISNESRLLLEGNGQADLSNQNMCIMKSMQDKKPGLLLDFGRELHGGLQIVTGMYGGGKPVRLRIRFGESVSEAMSEIEPFKNATNDHAMRDMVVSVPWLGKFQVGNTGFRFVRIDMVDDNTEFQLKEVRAVFTYRDIPYLGSFHSSDSLLNKIWLTGAYTVHLNMQEYLWDGIKRDRLVWVGDMHPETSAIAAVFGANEVVNKSLDLSRDITPLPQYMNGMVSYSMWWVIIQRDWYTYTGNLGYLKEQKDYLKGLLDHYIGRINSANSEDLRDGTRFLDWPSSKDTSAIHAGLQAMMVLTLKAGGELSKVLGDEDMRAKCERAVSRLKKNIPEANGSKQAAALLALAELQPAEKMNKKIISVGGVKNYSTFFGYYMLMAKAKAGDYQGALDDIRNYWGAMLKLGATTFWEDFNTDWVKNAAGIDELPGPGQIDIHSSYGDYCYKGFRHSFAHGWASGPTPWLTQYVLGVQVIEPGCRTLRIEPHLGDLSFAEGTFPTPLGVVKIKHSKTSEGKVRSEISAPEGIKIIK